MPTWFRLGAIVVLADLFLSLFEGGRRLVVALIGAVVAPVGVDRPTVALPLDFQGAAVRRWLARRLPQEHTALI